MQITNVTMPQTKYNIKCPYSIIPEYITIHNTANDASAMAEVSYMMENNNKISFHVAIDNEEVVTAIPFNRNAWHAGDDRGNGNMKSIGIEICYSKSGGDRFMQAERLAAEYVAYLLKQYGWGIDRVKKHQDWSGKYCPHRTLDMGWNRFLDMVSQYLGGQIPIYNNVTNDNGSDVAMKTYQNGSTSETVYSDTNCTVRVGSLNPRESCDCFGIFNNRAMVRYKIDGSNNYKIGFCKWLGGVR
jgi:N-acetylmuramoyl-L-alanine amidase CwlA